MNYKLQAVCVFLSLHVCDDPSLDVWAVLPVFLPIDDMQNTWSREKAPSPLIHSLLFPPLNYYIDFKMLDCLILLRQRSWFNSDDGY